jgi:hypothetical protein
MSSVSVNKSHLVPFRVVLRKFLRGLAIISMLFVAVRGISAAQFKLVQRNPSPDNQSWFYVDLMLEPENESINAVEGKIVLPPDVLGIYAVSDGNSIVSLWIDKPQVSADSSVIFSGIIPGGYQDTNGLILSLILKAKQTGSASISIADARALLNDGLGTAAKLATTTLNLKLTAATSSFTPPYFDQAPPEDFKPMVSSNPSLFDGKQFLVFATQDKDSGLDYYAVYESQQPQTKEQLSAADWQKAESPYLLKDQKFNSYIYVKAVDKAGNVRIVEVAPVNQTFSQWLLTNQKLFVIIGITIIAVILIGIIVGFILKRQPNRHGRKIKGDKLKN